MARTAARSRGGPTVAGQDTSCPFPGRAQLVDEVGQEARHALISSSSPAADQTARRPARTPSPAPPAVRDIHPPPDSPCRPSWLGRPSGSTSSAADDVGADAPSAPPAGATAQRWRRNSLPGCRGSIVSMRSFLARRAPPGCRGDTRLPSLRHRPQPPGSSPPARRSMPSAFHAATPVVCPPCLFPLINVPSLRVSFSARQRCSPSYVWHVRPSGPAFDHALNLRTQTHSQCSRPKFVRRHLTVVLVDRLP